MRLTPQVVTLIVAASTQRIYCLEKRQILMVKKRFNSNMLDLFFSQSYVEN